MFAEEYPPVQAHVCVWRPEVDLRFCSSATPTCSFEAGPLLGL